MAWCNGGWRRVYAVEDQHKYCNTLKTDTKYSHSVRSRPTLKDKECFSEGVVPQTLREISL